MLRSQGQQLGSIIILHLGHPLAGQTVPVVRRYREHGERLWVIELPDGSRQYVPASWCTSLASSESPSRAGDSSVGRESSEHPMSPLSLAALRDLAALVRHLRERAEARGEEHAHDVVVKHRRPGHEQRANTLGAEDQSPSAGRAASVGELPASGSPPSDRRDRADGAAAGSGTTDPTPRAGTEVKE